MLKLFYGRFDAFLGGVCLGLAFPIACEYGLTAIDLLRRPPLPPPAVLTAPPSCRPCPKCGPQTIDDGVTIPSGAFVIEGEPTAEQLRQMDATRNP